MERHETNNQTPQIKGMIPIVRLPCTKDGNACPSHFPP